MKLRSPVPTAGRTALAALALAGALAAGEPPPRPAAQAREFRLPLLRQNQQTGQLTGTGARTQPDGTLFLATARVEHQDPGGLTNLTLQVQATDCVVDLRQNRVHSPASIQVATADGQLTLEGVGFLWDQAAGELSVSNQVRTRLRKRPGAGAPAGAATGSLTIRADAMRLNLTAREVEFLGAVEAADPDLEVRARRLFARRDAAGRFDRLQVEGAVTLVHRRDGSRATGERAEYRLTDAGEEVELTGQPFWTDGVREARAEVFRFLRPGRGAAEILQALGAAMLKLPRDTNTLWVLPWPGGAAAPPPTPVAPERGWVHLSAGALWLALPPRPGPVQGLRAMTNVVIADVAGDWRATAALATWTNAVLELTGQPRWTGQGREVRAGVLRLHPVERAVEAGAGAWVQLPAAPWMPDLTGRQPGRADEATAAAPLVEVAAAAAVFRDGRLTFAPPVQARLVSGDTDLGRLACRELTVRYRERLEAIEATGAVRLEQDLPPGRRPRARQFECARLEVTFDAAGHPARLRAEGGVSGRQSETRRPDAPPEVTELTAGWLEAHFAAGTNRLESAVAGGGVRLARGAREARGEEAVYTAEQGMLELRGQPEVLAPEGRIAGATVLTWDPRRNRAGGRGPVVVRWTTAPALRETRALQRALNQGANPP